MKEIFEKIKVAGETADNSITDVILKIVEEAGEVTAEDLRVRNIKPIKDTQNPIEERKEESVDLLLATLDLCFRQMTEEEMIVLLNKKLNKWLSYKKDKYEDSNR